MSEGHHRDLGEDSDNRQRLPAVPEELIEKDSNTQANDPRTHIQKVTAGRVGSSDAGKVTFGVLFHDNKCANIFEALVGTLRAAKKRKIVAYDGELLLQGVHDNVGITLKPEADAVVKT